MNLVFTEKAWSQYLHWQETDPGTCEKLNNLIKECKRSPFQGLGKPEPLKDKLKGYWSRRLTLEDRVVYRVTGKGDAQQLEIVQCRFHY